MPAPTRSTPASTGFTHIPVRAWNFPDICTLGVSEVPPAEDAAHRRRVRVRTGLARNPETLVVGNRGIVVADVARVVQGEAAIPAQALPTVPDLEDGAGVIDQPLNLYWQDLPVGSVRPDPRGSRPDEVGIVLPIHVEAVRVDDIRRHREIRTERMLKRTDHLARAGAAKLLGRIFVLTTPAGIVAGCEEKTAG